MKSVRVTLEELNEKFVTRTFVSGSYDWVVPKESALGQIRNLPPFSESTIAPKTLGESNLGTQNQSMEPSTPTRAQLFHVPNYPVVRNWFVCKKVGVFNPPETDCIRVHSDRLPGTRLNSANNSFFQHCCQKSIEYTLIPENFSRNFKCGIVQNIIR